ncbi:sulfotransferase [Coleofasciculus sp. D1-CHI-01]
MNKPDFFIVGAPKCGTTSLCKYLDQHPDVFISKFK